MSMRSCSAEGSALRSDELGEHSLGFGHGVIDVGKI
jgi:hypothetical protein